MTLPTERRRFFSLTSALVLLASASVMGLGLACDRKPEAPAEAPNVLIIAIDTLRADKLGCHGSSLGLTPNIDAFAEGGVVFREAFAHAPWTLPSFGSLLTSTHPATHGAGGRLGKVGNFTSLSSAVRTLPECFRDQGYNTGAIVNVLFLSPTFKINRGFEDYDFQPPKQGQRVQRRASKVTDLAIQWITRKHKDAGHPFCLMVHYFDPHLTYDPPEEFRRRFAKPQDITPDPRLFGSEGDMIALRKGLVNPRALPMGRLEALYNGEIAYTDQQVGRLLDAVKKMGLADSTIVVLTADHGEEFLDHGGFEHGHTLFDEMIHIPLIIRQTGKIKPRVVATNVGHIDVAPTLCELAGIKPEATFRGRNLEPLLHGDPIVAQPVFSQGNMWGPSLESWRQDGYKLIKKPTGIDLFNVVTDPHEWRNLADDPSQAVRCKRMLDAMERALDQARSTADITERVKLNKAEQDKLGATGYLGGDDNDDDDDEDSADQTSLPTSSPATR